jgi:chemotaxis protein CheX
MISVPKVFKGIPEELQFSEEELSIYVIPLKWNGHEAFVVIGLE